MQSNVTKGNLIARLLFLISLLTLVLTKVLATPSQADQEFQQKAKMIKKIIEMVSWPNSIPKDNFTLCVSDHHLKAISALNGIQAGSHKIQVKEIPDQIKQPIDCQLVYLYNLNTNQQDNFIKIFDKKPVLLIGDMDSFALRGGAMNFTYLNNVLAVTVNMETMKKLNLYIDLKTVDKITVIPEAKELRD